MSTRVTTASLDEAPAATCSDFQGHRLAIGTATGAASVFDRAPGDRGWQLSATWSAHDSAVDQVPTACYARVSQLAHVWRSWPWIKQGIKHRCLADTDGDVLSYASYRSPGQIQRLEQCWQHLVAPPSASGGKALRPSRSRHGNCRQRCPPCPAIWSACALRPQDTATRGWQRLHRMAPCGASALSGSRPKPAQVRPNGAQLDRLVVLVRHGDCLCLLRSRLYSSEVPQLDGSSGWGLQSELWADERGAAGASSCMAWRPPSPNAPAMLVVSDGSGLWTSNVAMPQAPTSQNVHTS
jgi:hypothetical protein